MERKTRIAAAAAGGVVGLVGLPLLMAYGVHRGGDASEAVERTTDRLVQWVLPERLVERPADEPSPGLAGRRDSKLEHASRDVAEPAPHEDRQIAENAGVLGALREGDELDGVFGSSGLSSDITGGIGGLIGSKGIQVGAGGLSSRGAALGGGGTAESLGGLGTRGIGAGYGAAGGLGGVGATHWREPMARERYTHHGTNGMTLVIQDSRSTFAIDVDTASYAIARRMIRSRALPPEAAVRVEEFVNALHYDYGGPQGERPFAVHLEAAPHPWNSHHHVLRVGIQAQRPTGDRPPAHLTFLVDVSGSMSSHDKLPLAQQAMHHLVEHLGPRDTVAIATYAGSTRRVLGPTPISSSRQGAVHEAIDALSSGGGTSMGSGMELAYGMADASYRLGHENRVVVLSDGDANIGARSHEAMLASISEYAGRGITMTTVGFGTGNYQDTLMEQLANQGDGTYHYVDSLDEAKEVFGEDLASTLQTVARDVKIQVDFDPRAVYAYRLIGYENRDIADEDFRVDAVDAGEIGAGHAVTALYEVVLRDEPAGDLATVRIRAKRPGPDRPAVEWATPYPVAAVQPSFAEASKGLRLAFGVASFAEVLRGSEYAEETSLDRVADVVRRAKRPGREEDAELLSLVEAAGDLERVDPVPVAGPRDPMLLDPIVIGAVERSDVDFEVGRNLARIRYCYQRELTRNHTLAGKVVAKFVIASDGTVSSASIKNSTLNSAPVERCVMNKFYGMRFTPPRGGGIAIVSYPFLFTPA